MGAITRIVSLRGVIVWFPDPDCPYACLRSVVVEHPKWVLPDMVCYSARSESEARRYGEYALYMRSLRGGA